MELEGRILDVMGLGEEIGASTLVREKCGYNRTESKRIIDEFTGRSDNAGRMNDGL